MKSRLALLAAALMLPAVALPAGAQASGPETIATTMLFPTFPSAPPYVGTYSGSFTTYSPSGSVVDTGTVSVSAHLAAVPSPTAGVLHTERTLTGSGGTLELRCNEISIAGGPVSGSCVVQDATGIYAGLAQSGKLTGVVDLGASPPMVKDTLSL
jgi:hypothetical protein